MQVTLNIDATNFGSTIEEVFRGLSEQDKKEVATKVMMDVLTQPNGAERLAYEEQVINQIMAQKANDSYHRGEYDTPDKVRRSYEFRERTSKYQSTRELMVKEITSQAVQQYKNSVVELVANDENLKTIYEEVKQQIVASYPQMVQAALTQYLAGQMGQIGVAIQNTQNLSIQVGGTMSQLTSKLQQHGINLNS
jgi:uncharacterized membrane-anchored protein YjiN (DUF445 family)